MAAIQQPTTQLEFHQAMSDFKTMFPDMETEVIEVCKQQQKLVYVYIEYIVLYFILINLLLIGWKSQGNIRKILHVHTETNAQVYNTHYNCTRWTAGWDTNSYGYLVWSPSVFILSSWNFTHLGGNLVGPYLILFSFYTVAYGIYIQTVYL
jgi:hypothetical protein